MTGGTAGPAGPGGITIGCGAREVLDVPGPGVVLATYRRAAYLRLPAGVVALVGPDVPPGPLWITGVLGTGPHALSHPGDPVLAGDGWLDVAGTRLPLGDTPTWRGPLPQPADLCAALLLARDVLSAAPPSSLLNEPWRSTLHRAEKTVRRGGLLEATEILGGLGPGLTPAGDDVLAGILLAHRALAGAGVEDGLLAIARSAVTTDLSRALLAWAARGQAVEPVHDLLAALATGDRPAAVMAMERVANLGASSGADLLLGLRLGLEPLPARTPPAVHPRG